MTRREKSSLAKLMERVVIPGTFRGNESDSEASGIRLSRPLRWFLAATLAASAASMLLPQRPVVDAQQALSHEDATPEPAANGTSVSHAPKPVVDDDRPGGQNPWVAGAPAGAASAKPFDPFVGVVPPPPPPPPTVATPAAPAVAAPPPPPTQDYRFLGRVTGPDGAEQVLITRSDLPVAVRIGVTLDNGYVVKSISAGSIILLHPPSGTEASIQIPHPDKD